MSVRSTIKKHVGIPWSVLYIYRKFYYAPKDIPAALVFLFNATKSPTTFSQRLGLIGNFYKISYFVDCPHTEHELLVIARQILDLGAEIPGRIVEAGSFHGGSTAKLSLVAALCDRKFDVFDSFAGMPENSESHGKSIYGREHHFPKGSHAVPFEEVKNNVQVYGDPTRVDFYKGFFSDTMPHYKEAVAAACINVDLVQSTKDCYRYLYPLLATDGIIISQDAHFPWIIELFNDEIFWEKEIGIKKPKMAGLGSLKFVTIKKSGN